MKYSHVFCTSLQLTCIYSTSGHPIFRCVAEPGNKKTLKFCAKMNTITVSFFNDSQWITAWISCFNATKPLPGKLCSIKPTPHDDVIKWKHFPRNWPFVRGIHRSPVNSPHKGQWRGALICVWINDWVNNREAGDLRRYRAHYDVIVMGIYLHHFLSHCLFTLSMPIPYWFHPYSCGILSTMIGVNGLLLTYDQAMMKKHIPSA